MLKEIERRVNRRLVKYWQELKGNRKFPKESDINREEIEDIWDSCFLIKVFERPDKPSFRYSYLGDELIEAYNQDFTGADIYTQVEGKLGIKMRELMEDIVTAKQPLSVESDFLNDRNMLIKYRVCMLPLAESDDEGINYIFGGIRWRAF